MKKIIAIISAAILVAIGLGFTLEAYYLQIGRFFVSLWEMGSQHWLPIAYTSLPLAVGLYILLHKSVNVPSLEMKVWQEHTLAIICLVAAAVFVVDIFFFFNWLGLVKWPLIILAGAAVTGGIFLIPKAEVIGLYVFLPIAYALDVLIFDFVPVITTVAFVIISPIFWTKQIKKWRQRKQYRIAEAVRQREKNDKIQAIMDQARKDSVGDLFLSYLASAAKQAHEDARIKLSVIKEKYLAEKWFGPEGVDFEVWQDICKKIGQAYRLIEPEFIQIVSEFCPNNLIVSTVDESLLRGLREKDGNLSPTSISYKKSDYLPVMFHHSLRKKEIVQNFLASSFNPDLIFHPRKRYFRHAAFIAMVNMLLFSYEKEDNVEKLDKIALRLQEIHQALREAESLAGSDRARADIASAIRNLYASMLSYNMNVAKLSV